MAITSDLMRSEQAVVKTGDLVFPNAGDAWLDFAQTEIEGVSNLASQFAKSGSQGAGSKKDYGPITDDALRLKNKFASQGTSIEAQTAEMDQFKSNWANLGFSPTDIDNVLKTTDLSQFSANSTYAAQQAAEQQKADWDMKRIAAASRGVTPADDNMEAVGTEVLLTANKAKGVADALALCSTDTDKERLLQANISDMRQELHDNFNTFLQNNGAKITPELMTAYKQQRLASMLNSGWPIANAQQFIDRELALYDSIAKQSLTDAEGAAKWMQTLNDMQKAQNENKELKALAILYSQDIPMKVGVGKDAPTVNVSGAQWAALNEISPDAATSLFNSNQVQFMTVLGGALSVRDLDDSTFRWLVAPNNISTVVRGTQGESKKIALEAQEEATKRLISEATSSSREDLLSNRFEMSVAENAINTIGKESIEDLKANESQWLMRDQLAAQDFEGQAKLFDKLFDGEGVVIADPKTGAMRYLRATKQGSLVDATQEGWLIPWGDQDAITARDVAFGKSIQFINAEAKRVGMEKAIEMFNIANIKNSKALRMYGSYLENAEAKGRTINERGAVNRRGAAWGRDVPMSDEMASKILGYISNKDIDRAYIKEGLQAVGQGLRNVASETVTGIRNFLNPSQESATDIRNTTAEDWVIPPASGKIEAEPQVNAFVGTEDLPSRTFYEGETRNMLNSGAMSEKDLGGLSVEEYASRMYDWTVAEEIIKLQGVEDTDGIPVTPTTVLSYAYNKAEETGKDVKDLLEDLFYTLKEEKNPRSRQTIYELAIDAMNSTDEREPEDVLTPEQLKVWKKNNR